MNLNMNVLIFLLQFLIENRCQSILRGYLSDIDTSLEYSTEDVLRNVDNPLLLKAQSIIEVGLRRTNLREELYCQVQFEKRTKKIKYKKTKKN